MSEDDKFVEKGANCRNGPSSPKKTRSTDDTYKATGRKQLQKKGQQIDDGTEVEAT